MLRDPLIRVIKNKDGVLNTQSLVRTASGAGSPPSGGDSQAAAAAVPLVVSLASIENGEVDYIDEMQGISLKVRKIETTVTDFDVAKPLSMKLKAALLSDEKNVELEGTLGPLPAGGAAGGSPAAFPVDLEAVIDPVELSQVFAALPRLSQGIPKDLVMSGPVSARDLGRRARRPSFGITAALDGSRVEIKGAQGFHKAAGVPLVGRSQGASRAAEVRDRVGAGEVRVGGDHGIGRVPHDAAALDRARHRVEKHRPLGLGNDRPRRRTVQALRQGGARRARERRDKTRSSRRRSRERRR